MPWVGLQCVFVVFPVHCKNKCTLTQQLSCHLFLGKRTLTFLLKQLAANSSSIKNVKTFLPVNVVVFLQINTIEQNIDFKAV